MTPKPQPQLGIWAFASPFKPVSLEALLALIPVGVTALSYGLVLVPA